MPREKSCGAVVYRTCKDRIELLILKHRMGGHWSFPKGHVEAEESERETALREVREETGLEVELDARFRRQVAYSPRPGIQKDVVYFLGFARQSDTVAQEEEISEIRWVALEDAHKFLTYENDRGLIREAKKVLGVKNRPDAG